MTDYPCPGHKGVCKFCNGKVGFARELEGLKEVDFMGKPKIDFCCHHCRKNAQYNKKFDPIVDAMFHK